MEEQKNVTVVENEQTVQPEPQPRWKSWAVWASVLGALGLAGMWLAIFADVGVMVLAVLNAIRALNVKKL